ncbi:MAG: WG repeat-containing protein [Abditibacteriota bacterium]|nr:WG repeat-containing protein [Abditibacteriota bacterium]
MTIKKYIMFFVFLSFLCIFNYCFKYFIYIHSLDNTVVSNCFWCKFIKYKVIDENYKEISSGYDDIQNLKYDLFIVKKNEKYGIIDKNGTKIIDCTYSQINLISNKYYLGFINGSNIGSLYDTNEKVLLNNIDKRKSYIFDKNNVILFIDGTFYNINPISLSINALFTIKNNNIVFLNKKKKVKYNQYSIIKNMIIVKNENYDIYDYYGNKIVSDIVRYDYILKDKLLIFENNANKYGIINSNTDILFEPVYDKIFKESCSIGVYIIINDSTLIYYYSKKNIIFKPKENLINCYCYNDKLYVSNKDNKLQLIDTTNNIIIEGDFDFLHSNDEFVYCSKGEKEGVVKTNGDLLIPFNFSFVADYYPNNTYVENNKKYLLPKVGYYKNGKFHYLKKYFIGHNFNNNRAVVGYISIFNIFQHSFDEINSMLKVMRK